MYKLIDGVDFYSAEEVDERFDNESIIKERERALAAEKVLQDNIDTVVSSLADEEARAKEAENSINDTLNKKITDETTRAEAEENSLSSRMDTFEGAVEQETARAETAEKALQNNIDSEASRAQLAEETTENKLSMEIDRAKAAEQLVQENLNAENIRAEKTERDINNALLSESERAQKKETEIDEALSAESTRAKDAEKVLTDNLADEIQRATAAEDTEKARAEAAEDKLTEDLAAEVQRATAAEDKLTEDLAAEVQRATAAEDTEKARAEAAEQKLTEDLADEIQRATNKELELDEKVAAEEVRATAAEASLTTQILEESQRATAAEKKIAADLINTGNVDSVNSVFPDSNKNVIIQDINIPVTAVHKTRSTPFGAEWQALNYTLSEGTIRLSNGTIASGFRLTTDEGKTWRTTNVDDVHVVGAVHKMIQCSDGTILAATSKGIAYSKDNAITWHSSNTDSTSAYSNIMQCSNGTCIAIKYPGGKGKTVIYSTDSGVTWTETSTDITDFAYDILEYSTGFIIIVGNYNGYSTDFGVTWTEIQAMHGYTCTSISKNTSGVAIVSSNRMHALFRTKNGLDWQQLDIGKVQRTACVRHIFFVACYGTDADTSSGIKYSTDDGVTWNDTDIGSVDISYITILSYLGDDVVVATSPVSSSIKGTGLYYCINISLPAEWKQSNITTGGYTLCPIANGIIATGQYNNSAIAFYLESIPIKKATLALIDEPIDGLYQPVTANALYNVHSLLEDVESIANETQDDAKSALSKVDERQHFVGFSYSISVPTGSSRTISMQQMSKMMGLDISIENVGIGVHFIVFTTPIAGVQHIGDKYFKIYADADNNVSISQDPPKYEISNVNFSTNNDGTVITNNTEDNITFVFIPCSMHHE